MLEVLLYFLTFLIGILIAYATYTRMGGLLSAAGSISIMTGALLMAGGLELQKPASFLISGASGDNPLTTITYTTITSSSDLSVLILQWLFFLGGFMILLLEFALIRSASFKGPRQQQETVETIIG